METTLNDFHQDFMQRIYADATSKGILRSEAFYELFGEQLLESGDITFNYNIAEYNRNNIKICGYDYDDERAIITILGYKFYQSEELQSITLAEIESSFKGMDLYLTNCNDGGFIQQLEETQAAYSMTYHISNLIMSQDIKKFRFLLLTDGRATKNLNTINSKKILNTIVEYSVIDINYLYQQFKSLNTGGDYDTPVNLKCLNIINNEKYQSFLTFINGLELVEIYERYGQKLFEQNVRTFLQFRGGVNRGLKNTLEFKPEMFFAYNNGITATATEVQFDDNDANKIINIKNLQIVNGGQTTSSIYSAHKVSKIDVSNVFVQIKLSVVKNQNEVYDFVSKVSEYANTQNKVSLSDFYSNSKLHKEFKLYSQRIFVPQIGGSQTRTHWFYERVRGEYLNEQAYLTIAQKNLFKLQYPSNQFFDKTFLAKVEVAWLCRPDIVSKGAQDCSRYFKKIIDDDLEKLNLGITEVYYKDAVSKVILFRFIEKVVSQADWYNQAYRSQTVAYTVAYLSNLVNKTGLFFDFTKIWDSQSVSDLLRSALLEISQQIYFYITTPKEGHGNPAQWTKREQCWTEIKALNINVQIPKEFLLSKSAKEAILKDGKEFKKLDNDIEIQSFVVLQNTNLWTSLFDYYSNIEFPSFSNAEVQMLKSYSQNNKIIPNKKTYLTIYKLYSAAVKEGWEMK